MWFNHINLLNDIDSFRECEDYEEYVEYLSDNEVLSDNEISIHTIINILLNIIILVAINIYAFYKDLGFLNYLKFVAISFVISDIALFFLGKVFIIFGEGLGNLFSKIRIAMFKCLPRNKQLDKIKVLEEKAENCLDKVKRTATGKKKDLLYLRYNNLITRLEECNANIKTLEKLDDVVDKAIVKRYDNDVTYVESVLERFNSEIPTHSEKIQKKMKRISSLASEVLSTCKNEPLVVSRIMETFNIYIPELLNIVTCYERFNEDGKRENFDTLKTVFAQFEEHLIELKEDIQNNVDDSFNLSSELLLESLRKKKKEDN